ncbi:MAG: fibronectin type III domain-containing protein [Armatimonadetes bacterium]|nr:fibronectin type III domain-containing protein [Armatimonadota bacterium]
MTATIAGQITAAASNYEGAYKDLIAAESAYRSAIEAKDAMKEAFGNVFSQYLTQSYGMPSVTNATLASIGLDPKTVRGPFISPTTPLDFFVDVFSNGYAKFRWKRNGNTSSTVFIIEAKIEDGAWNLIWSGTRSKVELSGFAPGTEVSFRVYATKGDENSSPSNVVVIYSNGGSGELQIAA